ncbi:hypothetical protein Bealeia1_01397 [Candidatus Bealeia paramacronuclearis]|uniref:DUF2066 domain-containing protein n=1 Tax=Candidatus Bealeia paramacronuclearis TaxID=1921001 RepID=A0ABZ2C979_9PROT|nr:hypothetical protein [Candidatus Bealeia paramacronuclearis]
MKILIALMASLFSFTAVCEAKVLDEKGQPLPAIVEIFSVFNPQFGANPSLDALNTYGQKTFLRPSKSERLSPEALEHYHKLLSPLDKNEQQKLLTFFNDIGDIEAIFPAQKSYDYILIMGSTVQSMRKRLMFLSQLIEDEKLKLNQDQQLIFLVGDRTLFSSETKDVLLDPKPFPLKKGWVAPKALPKNENDLAVYIWNQLELPNALRSLRSQNPIVVKAEKRSNERRAQTDDTVKAWLEEFKVSPGSCLIISENPFIYYQELTMRVVFEKLNRTSGFTFEAVGPENRQGQQELPINLGVLLDNLARVLFLETQIKTLK